MLRLVRKRLGNKTYQRQKLVLRKLGRALSGMRDSTVQVKTLTWLRRRHPHQFSQREFEFLKEMQAKRQRAQLRTMEAATILRKGGNLDVLNVELKTGT